MKKLFAFFLAVALLSTLVPFSAFRVSAGNGVQAKIDQLLSVYPTGSYFTTTGKPHYMLDPSICPSDCGVCQLQNQNPNKLGGLPAGYETGLSGWQCWAFANYAFYHIFGYYGRSFESCPKVNLTNAKLGDIVSFTLSGFPHYGVYLYTSGSNVVVYDGNGDYYCGVRYGSSYSASAVNAVYRAPNYDEVNGSTPTPTPQPTYTDIAVGTYAVKNNHTGTYMCVSYGADNNLQNVDMYSEINAASRMVITKASTGYKIRPECCASRLVNPYGYTVTSGLNVNIYNDENDSTQWWQFQKVSDGYVIRSVQNPDCVLDTDGGNVFVSSYTGASTQIWSLISTASLVTPTISFDKSSYTLGETITISWQASPAGSNLSHYWITISDANGSIIVDGGLGGSTTYYNFTPSSVGTYSVKIYATPFGSQYGEGSLTDTKSVTVRSPHTHSYGSWKVRTAATCTANGTDYRTCACGAEETRTTTALGHNYTSVITKPTCTTGGYTTYTCTRCYSSYTANNTSATGHNYSSWKVRTAATCTANGIDYRTCACGAEETRTTTALGHNYTSVITKPTCTNGGYTTYTCSRCYNSYTGNNTSATGHNYSSWKVRTTATCTANGIDYRTCACGAEETRTTTALGHNYTSVTTKPTCTSGGYTTYNCINCGNSYTDNAVSALGHTDGEWITVTEPDIDVEGLKELHCATCGEVIDSEIIPAIEEDTYFLGDVNGDNKIDSFDYLLAKRACFNAYELGDDEQKRADVDGSGEINSADYVVIKRIAFGTYEFK